jgi:hypothetical protein
MRYLLPAQGADRSKYENPMNASPIELEECGSPELEQTIYFPIQETEKNVLAAVETRYAGQVLAVPVNGDPAHPNSQIVSIERQNSS